MRANDHRSIEPRRAARRSARGLAKAATGIAGIDEIVLDQRIHDQASTRRLRIVKYRGTAHGTNEYPFLIDEQDMSVLPITSLGLKHAVSDELISPGVPGFDGARSGR
jgi:KaiC/GvpD/RAD55 family RecA-like ATPase